jgi:hypothetical protein
MADPEARVVVTARDATGAAFASAERGVKTFARSLQQVRRIAAGFGLVFTGRMFAGWVKDAIEVEKLTAQQAVAIDRASKAAAELNAAFQGLARTASTELAPKLETALKFWKEFFFPTGSQFGEGADKIREQVDAQIDEVERLQKLLQTQTLGDQNANWFQRLVFGDHSENINETTNALAAARAELERLRDSLKAAMGGSRSQIITQDELVALETFIYELNQRPPLITQEELVRLESFIYELNNPNRPPIITQEELVALEEFIHELNTVAPALTQDEWVDLESFIYDLNHMETESEKAARAIGDDFRDAFANWLTDGEFRFKDFLKNIAAQWISSRIFSDLGKLGGSGSIFSKLFGGARAEGGPVSSGKAYVVGERGPEWFLPGQSGTVAPMAAGGPTVVQNFYNQVGIPPQWAAQTATAGQMAARAAFDAIKKQQRGER